VRLTGTELSLDPPALPDRIGLVRWVVRSRKLTQHVIEKRANRIDEEVPHGAWFGTSETLRFGLHIDRAALPDVPLDDVDIDDLVGDIAELVESLPLEQTAHSDNSHRWFSGTRFIGKVR
jgi:hypothetical protein